MAGLFSRIAKAIRNDAIDNYRDNLPVSNEIKDDGRVAPGQPQQQNTDTDLLWAVPRWFNNSSGIMSSQQSNVFLQLRQYAEMNSVVQYCVEQRQLQIAQMGFTVRHKDKTKKRNSRCIAVENLLSCPNRSQTSFFEFMMAFMHDLLVLDAVSIKPRYDSEGNVISLELLDSAYVTIKVDGRGQIPASPQPAYQFELKSQNVIKSYSVEDLMYVKMHPRTSSPYGQSSVEKCLNTLKSLLQRRAYQDDYFTEGNLPESMISVNEKMTPKQMLEFQEYFDMLSKMSKNKVKLIPHDFKLIQAKTAEMKLEIDEMYTREICAIFNVSSSALISDVNRATAETNRKQAVANGNVAYIKFVENCMTRLINMYFGYPELEFSFIQEDAIDPLQQAQALQLATGGQAWLTINEARAIYGMGPSEELSTLNNPVNSGTQTSDENQTGVDPTGEERLVGQKDVDTQPKTAKPELPNPNEDR